jgi:hypothetical protein
MWPTACTPAGSTPTTPHRYASLCFFSRVCMCALLCDVCVCVWYFYHYNSRQVYSTLYADACFESPNPTKLYFKKHTHTTTNNNNNQQQTIGRVGPRALQSLHARQPPLLPVRAFLHPPHVLVLFYPRFRLTTAFSSPLPLIMSQSLSSSSTTTPI